MVRPVVPTYQWRQTDDTAGQPDQQDHQVHPALRPLGGVVDRVVNGPIPGHQQEANYHSSSTKVIIIERTTRYQYIRNNSFDQLKLRNF